MRAAERHYGGRGGEISSGGWRGAVPPTAAATKPERLDRRRAVAPDAAANGYATAKACHLFRDFVEATAVSGSLGSGIGSCTCAVAETSVVLAQGTNVGIQASGVREARASSWPGGGEQERS